MFRNHSSIEVSEPRVSRPKTLIHQSHDADTSINLCIKPARLATLPLVYAVHVWSTDLAKCTPVEIVSVFTVQTCPRGRRCLFRTLSYGPWRSWGSPVPPPSRPPPSPPPVGIGWTSSGPPRPYAFPQS